MSRLLKLLSSLRVTLVGLVWMGLGLVADQNHWVAGVWAITPPLSLLVLNLAVAMFVDRRFHRQPMLFAFHLCLLLIAGLAGYGQMVTHEYRLLLAESQSFESGMLVTVRGGPVEPPALAEGFMRQGNVEVDYTPGLRRGVTRSEVWLADGRRVVIGDDIPLLLDGYRFYTTSNKGFAVMFTWLPDSGDPVVGSMLFPSFPASELMQGLGWRTPAGEAIKLTLHVPPSFYGERWTLMAGHASGAEVTVSVGERTELLQPASALTLRGGRLRYEHVGMWMGYKVRYDPTLPWLFSVAVLAVVFMALHFASRLQQSAPASALSVKGCVT